MACVLWPGFCALLSGANTLNVTPGGTERGADPIFDRHGEVVLNVRSAADLENAGKRKVGTESEEAFVDFAMLWAHRRLAGANMTGCCDAGVALHFF